MKCKTCFYYTILEPTHNSRHVCVASPPVLFKSEYVHVHGPNTRFPSPNQDWWCGKWRPKEKLANWVTTELNNNNEE